MIKNFRDVLALSFLIFILVWFLGWGAFVWKIGVTPLEALGVGTASGVFLKCFADVIQFYFRKMPQSEK